VHEPAAPAALEQHVEHGAPGAGDAPALLGHDRPQQALGERAVARRQDVAQAEEQPRLVGRGDARVEQPAADSQAAHAGGAADRPQAGVADDGVDGDRRRVVGAADHRRQARAGRAVEGAVRAQVGEEQHRLDEARRGRAARHAPPAQAPGGVHDRERDVAPAVRGPADRGAHPGRARRRGRGGRRGGRRAGGRYREGE
jgi:hypothetical protein